MKVPIFKTPEDFAARANEYFASLVEPVRAYNKNTKRMELLLNGNGEPVMAHTQPATITGLARYLGMSRKTLWAYKKKSAAFMEVVEAARDRVQEYAESRLFDKDGQKGAEFTLRCNFGWIPADVERELQIKEKTLALTDEKLHGVASDLSQINSGIMSLANMLGQPAPDRALPEGDKT